MQHPDLSFETQNNESEIRDEKISTNKYNLGPGKIVKKLTKKQYLESLKTKDTSKTKKKSSEMKAHFNVFRSFVGLGILSLPYAWSTVFIFSDYQTGVVLSCILFLLITTLSWYGVNLFLKVADHCRFEGSELHDLVGKIMGKFQK